MLNLSIPSLSITFCCSVKYSLLSFAVVSPPSQHACRVELTIWRCSRNSRIRRALRRQSSPAARLRNTRTSERRRSCRHHSSRRSRFFAFALHPLTKVPQVVLNVYDLVWDKDSKGGKNAGLVDLGLGFFHTGELRLLRTPCSPSSPLPSHSALFIVSFHKPLLFSSLSATQQHSPLCKLTSSSSSLRAGLELWGKEISFGHSKRYKSGVFAVKPKLVFLHPSP